MNISQELINLITGMWTGYLAVFIVGVEVERHAVGDLPGITGTEDTYLEVTTTISARYSGYLLLYVDRMEILKYLLLLTIISCLFFSLEQDQKYNTMDMLDMKTVMDKLHLKILCMTQT